MTTALTMPDPPSSLADLARSAVLIICGDGEVPLVDRICFADRWAVVQLSDGSAGRAFLFNGAHAVYGALDCSAMKACRCFVGDRADRAIARLLGGADASRDAGESELPAELADTTPSTLSLRRTLALAVVNALSFKTNDPERLAKRGFGVLSPEDRSFLQEGDRVVLIGAGMLMRESIERCARVDVIDMRLQSALACMVVDGEGVRFGPEEVGFHGVEDTARLVGGADVIAVTGSALANGTLFSIARLPRRSREFVVFGPSAQAPMECFSALGATLVLTSRVVDGSALVAHMMAGFAKTEGQDPCEGYLVRVNDAFC